MQQLKGGEQRGKRAAKMGDESSGGGQSIKNY